MKLVIGLGNPGEKFKFNRHNVGYRVIDKLSQILNPKLKILNKSEIQIFKSKNFMNESGSFVKKTLTVHSSQSTDHLYIVHDDLDIPLGSFKIQLGKGPKDHKGLLDIYDKLNTRDFWHVRVGIENRNDDSGLKIKGEDFVLQDFSEDEIIVLDNVIKEICKKLVT